MGFGFLFTFFCYDRPATVFQRDMFYELFLHVYMDMDQEITLKNVKKLNKIKKPTMEKEGIFFT